MFQTTARQRAEQVVVGDDGGRDGIALDGHGHRAPPALYGQRRVDQAAEGGALRRDKEVGRLPEGVQVEGALRMALAPGGGEAVLEQRGFATPYRRTCAPDVQVRLALLQELGQAV